MTGCNFVKGMVADNKTHLDMFKRAAIRLSQLLADEIHKVPEVTDQIIEAQKLFNVEAKEK